MLQGWEPAIFEGDLAVSLSALILVGVPYKEGAIVATLRQNR